MFGALGVGVQLMEAWGALCSLRVAVLGMQGAEELGGCEVRPVLLRVELRKGASDAGGTWGEGRLWLAGPCAPGSDQPISCCGWLQRGRALVWERSWS